MNPSKNELGSVPKEFKPVKKVKDNLERIRELNIINSLNLEEGISMRKRKDK